MLHHHAEVPASAFNSMTSKRPSLVLDLDNNGDIDVIEISSKETSLLHTSTDHEPFHFFGHTSDIHSHVLSEPKLSDLQQSISPNNVGPTILTQKKGLTYLRILS